MDAYSQSMPPPRRSKFVSPGLLKTMGNRLVSGREFNWTDVYERRPVAMVAENLARELWHDPPVAIGKRIRERLNAPWREGGVACGLAAAVALIGLMTSVLFDVNPVDPATYLVVSASLVAAVLLAAICRALRAARMDPVQALHAE
jgi:hypothetical protein